MEKEKVYQMTNDHGKRFLNDWFLSKEILGIERTESNISRKEFTIIYRYPDGNICAAVLPDESTINNGCCFFGDLQHFAMCYAEGKTNVRLRLCNSGKLMWPVWYTEKEDFLQWKKFYDEMMQKYS
jgi:hypothetical protein